MLWYKVIIVSALSLRDKERLSDREIGKERDRESLTIVVPGEFD